MGIYEESGIDFGPLKELKKYLVPLLVILVLIGAVYVLADFFKPTAINDISFSRNPLFLSKDLDTVLSMSIANITNADAELVTISVTPNDEKSLRVFPSRRTEEKLPLKESRQEEFRIEPLAEAKEGI